MALFGKDDPRREYAPPERFPVQPSQDEDVWQQFEQENPVPSAPTPPPSENRVEEKVDYLYLMLTKFIESHEKSTRELREHITRLAGRARDERGDGTHAEITQALGRIEQNFSVLVDIARQEMGILDRQNEFLKAKLEAIEERVEKKG